MKMSATYEIEQKQLESRVAEPERVRKEEPDDFEDEFDFI